MAIKVPTKKAAKPVDTTKQFAVIQTGGKQYLVSAGDTLKIEKIKGALAVKTHEGREEFKVGDKVVFDEVILVDDGAVTTVGAPFIKGAAVSAEIKKIAKAPKVTVIKYKAKSNYYKKRGHRQPYFEVLITNFT